MGGKKTGGAKAAPALTPEQIAAKRAAAMAMYGGGAPAKPAAPKVAPTPPPPPPEAQPDAPAPEAAAAAAAGSAGKVEPDRAGESAATAYVADTLAAGPTTGLTTKLPATGSRQWEQLLHVDPLPEMYKKAKKQGTMETIDNGCRVYHFKDVAYLTDAEGRSNVTSWRTALKGASLDSGEQPYVRHLQGKARLLEGSDDGKRMAKAVATHTGAALLVLPTGHVQLRGSAESCEAARGLIDDLVDGDGSQAREKLAALLVVAEAWGGALEIAVPEEWIGAVIGKGGAGIKAIAAETGCTIDVIDPPEEAADAAAAAEGGEQAAGALGVTSGFVCKHKFEKSCRLAASRIEERLALLKRLDVSGYVMVPRASVGRLIGKAGANIKLLQRTSGASRITFDKEPSGRATSQMCALTASDLDGAIGAALVLLRAVPRQEADSRNAFNARLANLGAQLAALSGTRAAAAAAHDALPDELAGDAPPPIPEPPPSAEGAPSLEALHAAHKARFASSASVEADKMTKDHPAELAAHSFDVWQLQWAVADDTVY